MEQKEIKIMIVDDEVETTIGLKAYLRHDFEVVSFNDVREAKAYLETNTTNIIICDQRMPYKYGLEFLIECKTLAPDAMRILFSAHVAEAELTNAIEDGTIFKFIHKPISLDWGKFDGAIQNAINVIRGGNKNT